MDLRNFISLLEQAEEIVRIKDKVNWKYEIGERSRQAQASGLRKHALLFENIKDYPGHRILTNGLNSYSKIAIALQIEAIMPFKNIVEIFKKRFSNPFEPIIESGGPVKENILIGDDIDLLKLPVPWWNREDVGRYIGTWHLNITKDPETCCRNVGVYRMQLLGKKKAAISISPKSHLAIHLKKAESKGVPLEMAVAIGVDEAIVMAAAAAPPYRTDEYNLAGGLRQKSIVLTRCQTVDLEVPASSEIIIEGKIISKLRVKEGPFLDYSGVPSVNPNGLVFEVSCLMFRNNPIFRGSAIGIPGAEDHLLLSLLSCAKSLDFHGSRIRQKIQNALLKKGFFSAFQFMGRLHRS